jgi:hypothetical protein
MRDTILDHPDLPDEFDYVPMPISIRLRNEMRFQLLCDPTQKGHEDHPQRVTLAQGALLGGMQQASGDVIVTALYKGHGFKILFGEYRVVHR